MALHTFTISSSLTPLFLSVFFFFFFFFFFYATADKPYYCSFAASTSTKLAEETRTHLHFYLHDIVVGRIPTAVRVAEAPPPKASSGFGNLAMIDDPLTQGPEEDSKLIGRAQGLYALASLEEQGDLLMAMNLAFMDGHFNGSSLTVLGRNTVFTDVREMPVVGGSGRFRLARGYALARTQNFSRVTGNAVVEYNITVLHY